MLRYQLGQYLLETRGGDVSTMVRALVNFDSDGFRVVGIRDRGHEVICYYPQTMTEGTVSVHAIVREGDLSCEEIVFPGEFEPWLEEHRDELK